jgi:hypothetical protein
MKTNRINETHIEKLEELTCELLRYCGPVFVAPSLHSHPNEMIANGTYALIDTGQRRLLVTCCHVWDEYQQQHDNNREATLGVVLGDGGRCIAFKNPEKHLLANDRDLDLVVLEFAPTSTKLCRGKSWFKILDFPIPKAEKGEYIITMGFPKAWRTVAGKECKFGYAPIPLAVTATNDRTIATFYVEGNLDVLNDIKDSLAGVSGSPAYRLTDDGELGLVGFAKMGPEESNAPARKYQSLPGSQLQAVFFTHACFLQPDGTLVAASSYA